ncbi:MAG TPA: hypothetical protein VG389_12360 [Myxococcota bacterium]|nr:hypothetical protein [Myxococcota bacterium]
MNGTTVRRRSGGLLAAALVAAAGAAGTGCVNGCHGGFDVDAGAGDGAASPDAGDGAVMGSDAAPPANDQDEDFIPDQLEGSDEMPPTDTDGDGTPDYLDDDSDNDTISDLQEGLRDTDAGNPDPAAQDGVPDFRDHDSDGDGIPDDVDAGDADLATAPVDTDMDGAPDYRDLDSDADGLADAAEDPNGNGTVDPGESDPFNEDTDGDGFTDLVEVAAGTDPTDAASGIPAEDFFFILPYMDPPQTEPLDFMTDIVKADIFFAMDTTASYGGEITNLQTALSTLLSSLTASISDANFGVGRVEDFPVAPFGSAGDVPFGLLTAMTTDASGAVTAAVNALDPAAGGGDIPEGSMEALYQIATGSGLTIGPTTYVPPVDCTGYVGMLGGACFRTGALPIVVLITDAPFHIPPDYTAGGLPGTHSASMAISALNGLGAKVIGIASNGAARADLEYFAYGTQTWLAPEDLGAAPGSTDCYTGLSGAIHPAAANGLCPLVFDVDDMGSGLGGTITDAILGLAELGTIDVSVDLVGEATSVNQVGTPAAPYVLAAGTTSADFINGITPVPPPPPGAIIFGDEFRDVTPGSTVTFDVEAENDFLMSEPEPLLFHVVIRVIGDGVTVLDSRDVYLLIPPEVPMLPIG